MKPFIYKTNDVITTKHNDKLLILKCIRKKFSRNANYKKGYIYKCLTCNHIGDISEVNLKNGCGCEVCHGNMVEIGINDLWTTHPEIAKLLLNKRDGYVYSHGSSVLLPFVCQECGNIKHDTIDNINRRGLICPRCSDGISYPNKIMYSVLQMLNIDFENEKQFSWSKNKKYRYDFYIKNLNMIIEMHGKQHYKTTGGWAQSEKIKSNDKMKHDLAMENGMSHYIIVDAQESNIEYIRHSIEKELKNYFNFKNIDWTQCDKYATISTIKKVCLLWNENDTYTTKDIAKITKLSVSTISNYLKNGNEIGFCTYNKSEAMRRSHIKVTKQVRCIDTGEVFNSVNVAADKYHTNPNTIRACCKKVKKHAGNLNGKYLSWEYV